MPVAWRKSNEDYSIIVWQSTEEMNDLFQTAALNEEDTLKWKSFRSDSRKREWLTVRNVLLLLLPRPALSSIVYDANGKPHLKENGSISISHSHEFIAVMKSDEHGIGVDIEVIHPRIEILSQKFLSEKEKPSLADKTHLEKLHVMWGAKEVLYKIHSIGDIDFKKDFFVYPFQFEQKGELKASILKKGFEKDYKINYEKINGHMLTWATSPH